MIIKSLLVLILFNSLIWAKTYKSSDQFVGHGGVNPSQNYAKKKGKVTRGKSGEFKISWGVLAEYDLSKKKLSSNLKKVLNKDVSINGFMLPLDYSAKYVSEFLLLPYIPTCAHVPPPASNTIVKVIVPNKSRVKVSYAPIRVLGRLIMVHDESKKIDPYAMEGIYQLTSKSVKVDRK